MSINVRTFEVIEDNGGGLSLFIFDSKGRVEYAHTGYEHVQGQLSADLADLAEGGNPVVEWEGCEEDPQGVYDSITSYRGGGWEVVADNNGIYPNLMGSAAALEFGIDPEAASDYILQADENAVMEPAAEPDWEPEM